MLILCHIFHISAEKIEDKLLVISAEVKKGFLPVMKATVYAIITQEGVDEDIVIPLKDDGIGRLSKLLSLVFWCY